MCVGLDPLSALSTLRLRRAAPHRAVSSACCLASGGWGCRPGGQGWQPGWGWPLRQWGALIDMTSPCAATPALPCTPCSPAPRRDATLPPPLASTPRHAVRHGTGRRGWPGPGAPCGLAAPLTCVAQGSCKGGGRSTNSMGRNNTGDGQEGAGRLHSPPPRLSRGSLLITGGQTLPRQARPVPLCGR